MLSVQDAVLDDQQPNLPEQDAFEQQLDAARVAVPTGLAQLFGRKPPKNVSRADHDYILAMVKAGSARRKLKPATAR
ncbi:MULTISPECIES: hypothetical protein [Bradyrhizobium]|uniref:Uncharacterized protein n=1 Tax=Bradyrhizobium frederickii TaxID=2560054 RepID=A0A4Y9NL49_9BRAD|nr:MULTISPECIES: hypothetical protein [Bradyrhizobium]TFV29779.1 hypothetical protein E4K66_37000 [Bradyrhizobium frederickii]TFV68434.1 hypothetical protein E4K64_36950 [Bradyrhizobium frederickii]